MTQRVKVGIVGARGYVGAELLKLLAAHPHFEVALVTSREHPGKAISEIIPEVPLSLHFVAMEPTELADGAGADIALWVLALPNNVAATWADAIEAAYPAARIIDLSYDFRFDSKWVYGLPERTREQVKGAKLVSNPGCYATGAQLMTDPLKDLLAGPASIFGVSGYSGSGTKPNPRNDKANLSENLMGYSLIGHGHEAEIRHQLGVQINFTPHVADFFRGIVLTAHIPLKEGLSLEALRSLYKERYANEPLVVVNDEIPWPKHAAGKHVVTVGGFSVNEAEKRAVVMATLDNLLKGAATQCLQNMNLMLGFPELAGISAQL